MARSPPLREAHEETGLNPDTVEIVGVLPTLALPDTGFLLIPVLAWSAQPAFPEPANLAEVTATYQSALAHLAARHHGPAVPARGGSDATGPDLTSLGRVTGTIIDLLLAALDGTPAEDGQPTVDGQDVARRSPVQPAH